MTAEDMRPSGFEAVMLNSQDDIPPSTKSLRFSTAVMTECVIETLAKRRIVAAVAYQSGDDDKRPYLIEWYEPKV
jgi:hypothetical protein